MGVHLCLCKGTFKLQAQHQASGEAEDILEGGLLTCFKLTAPGPIQDKSALFTLLAQRSDYVSPLAPALRYPRGSLPLVQRSVIPKPLRRRPWQVRVRPHMPVSGPAPSVHHPEKISDNSISCPIYARDLPPPSDSRSAPTPPGYRNHPDSPMI